jgi:hypothetical protein
VNRTITVWFTITLCLAAQHTSGCGSTNNASGIADSGTNQPTDASEVSSRQPPSIARCGWTPDASLPDAAFDVSSFFVPGTHYGDMSADVLMVPSVCGTCHSLDDESGSGAPYDSWVGSLMANAGRDPLFLAQLTTANQDVPGVGYYCQRCHVPVAAISGTALDPTGHSLTLQDQVGVSCHFCHSMVDPGLATGAASTPENSVADAGTLAHDRAILSKFDPVPPAYGNAMFVLDPTGLRRGPYPEGSPLHPAEGSDFFDSGNLCGTCHDVGNIALTRQADGSYAPRSSPGSPADLTPVGQFPLERTYTEWRLSAYGAGEVDTQGRFGGNLPTVSACQDCHMPTSNAAACYFTGGRPQLPVHEFAGSADWVLSIIEMQADPQFDNAGLERGRANARSMLSRAATLDLASTGGTLHVKVTNESGHKLPTGHIEGRRVFVNVQMLDPAERVVQEYGHYDADAGTLDEDGTLLFEMKVGLSAAAAARTCLPEGVTSHMSVADTIAKDTRIPPRGFTNQAYEQAGAPVVGASYADGQFWAEAEYPVAVGATHARVGVYYQVVTPEYIRGLRNNNVSDLTGETLYGLWEASGRAAPLLMVEQTIAFAAP